MRTITVNNFILQIGKNAKENDLLIKTSNPEHIWFHLADLPSCHGVINCKSDQLTKSMRYICVCQIKKYTKYKEQSWVMVNI